MEEQKDCTELKRYRIDGVSLSLVKSNDLEGV